MMKKGLLIIMGIGLLTACAPQPKAISRGYKNPVPKHTSPARTMSGPNSNSFYKR